MLDVVDIGISAGSSYDWSKHTSSSSSFDMTIEYPGVTIVQIDPLTLSADNTTGWYDESLLRSIVTGSGDDSVSGFKIAPMNDINSPEPGLYRAEQLAWPGCSAVAHGLRV